MLAQRPALPFGTDGVQLDGLTVASDSDQGLDRYAGATVRMVRRACPWAALGSLIA